MASHFLEMLTTPAVLAARQKYYERSEAAPEGTAPDRLTDDEIEFIGQRESFYMASVAENGWPYIQHRGGPPGFLHVVNPGTLAFADLRGNRQLLTVGNLSVNDRVALFIMSYPHRARLKILGRARVVDAREQPEVAKTLADPASRAVVERIFFIDVVSYDWNCPQHITPRFTTEEVKTAIQPLRDRIAELEGEVERLRKGA